MEVKFQIFRRANGKEAPDREYNADLGKYEDSKVRAGIKSNKVKVKPIEKVQ